MQARFLKLASGIGKLALRVRAPNFDQLPRNAKMPFNPTIVVYGSNNELYKQLVNKYAISSLADFVGLSLTMGASKSTQPPQMRLWSEMLPAKSHDKKMKHVMVTSLLTSQPTSSKLNS